MSDKEDCQTCSVVTHNKEYIEALSQFYNDRLKCQLKDKFSRCADCKEKKQFISKQGELIYGCGSKSGNCGPQMTVNLAKYCFYPEMKEESRQTLNKLVDLGKFKEIYLSKEIKEQIKEQKQEKQNNEKLLKKCKKAFEKQNDISKREGLIKKTHRDRMISKKDQNLLLTKIRSEEDKDKKQTLMKEYIQINQRLKEEYNELMKSNKRLNQFLLVEAGSVTKHTSRELDTPEIIKSKIPESDIPDPDIPDPESKIWVLNLKKDLSKKEIHNVIQGKLNKDELISRILKHFIKNDILTKKDYLSKIRHDTDQLDKRWSEQIPTLQKTGIEKTDMHHLLIDIQYSIKSSIIEEPGKKPEYITITKPWKDLLLEVTRKGKEE